MKYIENVQGSAEQAKELVIGKDTVYVHSNITEVTVKDITMYQYDETQYTKDEYIKLLSDKAKELEKQNELTQEVLDVLLFSE